VATISQLDFADEGGDTLGSCEAARRASRASQWESRIRPVCVSGARRGVPERSWLADLAGVRLEALPVRRRIGRLLVMAAEGASVIEPGWCHLPEASGSARERGWVSCGERPFGPGLRLRRAARPAVLSNLAGVLEGLAPASGVEVANGAGWLS
jgi:hypothetical protein